MTKPLEGVRVLDFTWVRAGPWATRWLAVLGAEVLKVEWPDPRLTFNGRVGGLGGASEPNASGPFNDANADKKSITVNVRSERGLQIIKDLLRVTDVVVENFSARVMRDWGLSYEVMAELKPDIIYVSMAGFGQAGRHAAYNTMGPSVQALSGLTFVSGLPDAPPAGWGWSYMDDTGGLYGAMCALTALHHKQATGEGQHVDMSQVAAGITLTGPALLDLTANGRSSRRPGFPPGNRAHWPGTPLLNNYRGRTVAPHNAYRTLGGDHFDWIAIVCHDDAEWQALVQTMGRPAWAQDAKFALNSGRLEHQDELDRGIEAWTVTTEKYALTERLQAAGVRAAPVQSNEDRVEHDPQLRAREMFEPLTHPVVGTYPMQQAPFKLSGTPVPVTRHAPLLGEHNIEILSGLLGIPWEDIRAGYDDGTLWPSHVPIDGYEYLLDPPASQQAEKVRV
ncbi:MAG: CoA transferase [Chloroflexi bacterium]|nr:CoA transferase [Chloroflexota bacterium]